MKEVTFVDRVPTYPGRVVLTPVAGQANTYDMVRSDSPVVEGTPLDKATFESVVHSRLTGRYYVPTVSVTTLSNISNNTVNPIPISGWYDASPISSSNGGYKLTATAGAQSTNYSVSKAFDGNDSTLFASSNTITNITLELIEPITVKKIKMRFGWARNDNGTTIQGSNNGTSWATLLTLSANQPSALTEYTLTSQGAYKYYRFNFSATASAELSVYTIAISSYDVSTHRNDFTVSSGMPIAWDAGQRVTIETPSNVNTVGVTSNTFSGKTVTTILQPSTRYELRYTGSVFVAKEV